MLKKLRWLPDDHFPADFSWLGGLTLEQIADWVVILPQHAGKGARATVAGHGPLSVFRRKRRRDPLFGASVTRSIGGPRTESRALAQTPTHSPTACTRSVGEPCSYIRSSSTRPT